MKTLHWIGEGDPNNMMDPQNWAEKQAPANNDDLVLPAPGAYPACPLGMVFNSVTVEQVGDMPDWLKS